MIITFLLTLIPIIAATVIAILTGGGTIQGLVDWISFAGVVVLFVVAIIGSGYGKPFFRIFSSKKKFQSLNLQELKKTDQTLEFAGKILFYTAVLIPVLVLIYTLRNFYKDAGTCRHLGPNMAVLLLSILYMALIEMILCTLKAKTHKAVIMYMADEKMLERYCSAAAECSNRRPFAYGNPADDSCDPTGICFCRAYGNKRDCHIRSCEVPSLTDWRFLQDCPFCGRGDSCRKERMCGNAGKSFGV